MAAESSSSLLNSLSLLYSTPDSTTTWMCKMSILVFMMAQGADGATTTLRMGCKSKGSVCWADGMSAQQESSRSSRSSSPINIFDFQSFGARSTTARPLSYPRPVSCLSLIAFCPFQSGPSFLRKAASSLSKESTLFSISFLSEKKKEIRRANLGDLRRCPSAGEPIFTRIGHWHFLRLATTTYLKENGIQRREKTNKK